MIVVPSCNDSWARLVALAQSSDNSRVLAAEHKGTSGPAATVVCAGDAHSLGFWWAGPALVCALRPGALARRSDCAHVVLPHTPSVSSLSNKGAYQFALSEPDAVAQTVEGLLQWALGARTAWAPAPTAAGATLWGALRARQEAQLDILRQSAELNAAVAAWGVSPANGDTTMLVVAHVLFASRQMENVLTAEGCRPSSQEALLRRSFWESVAHLYASRSVSEPAIRSALDSALAPCWADAWCARAELIEEPLHPADRGSPRKM